MNSFFPTASQPEQKRKRTVTSCDGPRLSINAVSTFGWSFAEDVVQYRTAGVGAIGLWLPKLLRYGEERGVELLAMSGLPVSTLSWGGGFTGAFGCELVDVLQETRELIHLAKLLRAKSLVLVSGPKNRHLNKHANRLLVDSLKELADDAANNGVILSLQTMLPQFEDSWTFLHSLDHALEVLGRVNHPSVKLAFDVFHLGHELGLLQRLPELVPQIGVVQVSDRKAGVIDEYDRVLPGQGTLPVKEILSGLIAAGYRGDVDYQVWSRETWRSLDVAWLQECQGNFEELCPTATTADEFTTSDRD